MASARSVIYGKDHCKEEKHSYFMIKLIFPRRADVIQALTLGIYPSDNFSKKSNGLVISNQDFISMQWIYIVFMIDCDYELWFNVPGLYEGHKQLLVICVLRNFWLMQPYLLNSLRICVLSQYSP